MLMSRVNVFIFTLFYLTKIDFILRKFDRKSGNIWLLFSFSHPCDWNWSSSGSGCLPLSHVMIEMRCNKASHTALKILRSSAKINCSHLTPLLWAPPTLLWWQWPIRSRPQLTLTNERPALGHVTCDGDPGPGTDLSCHGDGKHITHHNHHDVI